MRAAFIALAVLSASAAAHNFLISNDDGWATAQARAQYNSLVAAGYDVILSAPAVGHSGAGSTSQTPTTLKTACQFNSCPVGSPAEGSDATDPRLNYVNGFGPDAVKYGIQTLAPEFFGGPPDIVISGPNIFGAIPQAPGSPSGTSETGIAGSSNFQVAVEAVKLGIPGISFAGNSDTTYVSYTTLTTNPNSADTKAAMLYADLATLFTGTLWNTGAPFLPPNQVLSINFPSVAGCPAVSDYKFVLSKIATGQITTVQTCNRTELPQAAALLTKKGCFASVALVNATTLQDVTPAEQQAFIDKMGNFLSC